jgi:hypothetical protein
MRGKHADAVALSRQATAALPFGSQGVQSANGRTRPMTSLAQPTGFQPAFTAPRSFLFCQCLRQSKFNMTAPRKRLQLLELNDSIRVAQFETNIAARRDDP